MSAKNMSIAINQETQDKLKEIAKKRNITTSKLIRDIVEKNLVASSDDVDTVILKIPNSVKESGEETLRNWLTVKVEAVIKALVK